MTIARLEERGGDDDDARRAKTEQRVHECLPRTEVDLTGPRVASLSLDPPFATDGVAVRLALEFDEAVSSVSPQLIFAGGVQDPGFGLEQESTPSIRTFLLVVDAAVPSGAYRITSVRAADKEGNEATTDLDDLVLVVDRTAPVLRSAGVDPPGTVFTDVPGVNDTVRVIVDADEPLDTLNLALGLLEFTCGLREDTALGYACEAAFDVGALSDGQSSGVLLATDLAGNSASTVVEVVADTAAPAVFAGTLALELQPPPGGAQLADGTATAGTRVALSFITTEALVDPAVTLDTGGLIEMQLDSAVGRAYSFSTILPALADETPIAARSHFVDAVGHTADVELGAFTFVALPFSPCTFEDDEGPQCTDFDDDGFIGRRMDCPDCCVADDCDDGDPLTYPGAPEIPGDGKANDCDGEDAPIDETMGVFVDSDLGSDIDGDGSREAPFLTYEYADDVALPAQYIFLAGATPQENVSIEHSVVGGLDPASGWTPTGARSVLLGADMLVTVGYDARLLVGCATDETLRIDVPATLLSTYANRLDLEAPTRVVRSEVNDEIYVWSGGNGSRLVDTEVSRVSPYADVRMLRVKLGRYIDANDDARVLFMNSWTPSTVDTYVVAVRDTATFHAVHSLFAPTEEPLQLFLADGSGELRFTRSIIEQAPEPAVVFSMGVGSTARSEETLYSGFSDSAALIRDDDTGMTIAIGDGFAAALGSVHVPADGFVQNIRGDALINGADVPRLFAGSAAIDALAWPAAALGVPTALAGDLDKECRFAVGDEVTSIGPDDD